MKLTRAGTLITALVLSACGWAPPDGPIPLPPAAAESVKLPLALGPPAPLEAAPARSGGGRSRPHNLSASAAAQLGEAQPKQAEPE
jgi:hypothetical protein